MCYDCQRLEPFMRRVCLSSVLSALVLSSACGSPPPTCAATDVSYRICSDNQVWECPVATAPQLAAKKAIDDGCRMQMDQVKCLLDAKYEQLPMKLAADCRGGGQVCVTSTPASRDPSCVAR